MKTLTNMMLCELMKKMQCPIESYEKRTYRVKNVFELLKKEVFLDERKHVLYEKLVRKILSNKRNKQIIIHTFITLASTGPIEKHKVMPILYRKLFNETFRWDRELHRDRMRRLLNTLALLLFIDPYRYFNYDEVALTPISYTYYHHYQQNNPSDPFLALTFPGRIVLRGKGLFFNDYVRVYHEFIVRYWRPLGGKRVALFTPCSSVKPIPRSFMNVKVDGVLRRYGLGNYVDRFIVSEPLVLIPYEFAYYFPAAHYDYHPSLLTSEERRVYVELLRRVIEDKIAKNYGKIVYFLPRFHRRIFEEAVDGVDVETVYVPYNVYYLPVLRDVLLREAREVGDRRK